MSVFLLGKSVIIVGDFNCYNLGSTAPTYDHRSFIIQMFLHTLGLNQYNQIYNCNNRLLDLVLTNINCEIAIDRDMSPIVLEDPNHPALSISVFLKQQADLRAFMSNNNKRYNFKRADLIGLYSHVANTDWSFIENFTDVDEATTAFYDIIYNILDLYVHILQNILSGLVHSTNKTCT